jgi:hypothetical protein
MNPGIKKGDKILIKDNLMEELVKVGFDKIEMEPFVERFKGKVETAYDVYEDEDSKGNKVTFVTVELCCEVPLNACELIIN